jgi:hypothetical protein
MTAPVNPSVRYTGDGDRPLAGTEEHSINDGASGGSREPRSTGSKIGAKTRLAGLGRRRRKLIYPTVSLSRDNGHIYRALLQS